MTVDGINFTHLTIY